MLRLLKVVLVVALLVLIYAYDRATGLVPDVSGFYLIPIVLAAYWFGLLPALVAAAVVLSADYFAHPLLHRDIIVVHNVTHLITYSFAIYVTSRLRNQLATIRALEGSRDYELGLARRLNEAVIEQRDRVAGGRFDVAIRSVPARELGGDQVFLRETDEGLFGCIADISGKGVSAALFAALLRAQIDDALADSFLPEEVIRKVNARLYVLLPAEMFVTMFCFVIREETLRFANAGHEPGLVSAGGATQELLSSDAPPVGVRADLAIVPREIPFARGATVLNYSDGVTDSEGFAGDHALIEDFFERRRGSSATELADALVAAASPRGSAQRDDMSVVVVRAL